MERDDISGEMSIPSRRDNGGTYDYVLHHAFSISR